jgi:hypothetical protein
MVPGKARSLAVPSLKRFVHLDQAAFGLHRMENAMGLDRHSARTYKLIGATLSVDTDVGPRGQQRLSTRR